MMDYKKWSESLTAFTEGAAVRGPFRIGAGFIASASTLALMGALYVSRTDKSVPVLPLLCLFLPVSFLTGFIAVKGRLPFTKAGKAAQIKSFPGGRLRKP